MYLHLKKSDILKRKIAYYIAVSSFFILLPIVLSYSLGYKVDYRSFGIYKTGIISLKSAPSGASIFINGREHEDITPARIEELKPGTYGVEVRREGFYPWQKQLVVRPNMVTKAEEIILFPVSQEMARVSEHSLENFVISDRNQIYYLTRNGLFRSDIDGSGMKRLSMFSNWPSVITGKKLSPDSEKLMIFNNRSIWVIYLNVEKWMAQNGEQARVDEVLKGEGKIIDAFWHSESNYIVFVTEDNIKTVELGSGEAKNVVTLYKFSARPRDLKYDEDNDSLYFGDDGKDIFGNRGYFLYRLDLREKPFDKFMERIKKEFDVIYEKK